MHHYCKILSSFKPYLNYMQEAKAILEEIKPTPVLIIGYGLVSWYVSLNFEQDNFQALKLTKFCLIMVLLSIFSFELHAMYLRQSTWGLTLENTFVIFHLFVMLPYGWLIYCSLCAGSSCGWLCIARWAIDINKLWVNKLLLNNSHFA